MREFSKVTQAIIDAHKGDFDCTNYTAKLKSYGGYSGYLNKLGGVFKKWNGKTASVKTAAEFREIAEYVFGLYSIYGLDYNNGKIYRRWAGGKPFYVGSNKGRSNWGRVDDICGKSSKAKTTNCNYAADALLYKAGLFGGKGQPTNSCAFRSHVKKGYKFFRDIKDLQAGDQIQFFGKEVTTNNCNDWKEWHHVAVVAGIENGKVYTYDGGGRFITTGSYIKHFYVDSKNHPQGVYSSYKGWVAIRTHNLLGAKRDIPAMDTRSLAVATIHGEFSSGYARELALGDKYDAAQKLVTSYMVASNRDEYIRACANFVLAGYAGKDKERKNYFGKDYDEVQKKVNYTIDMAEKVWAGKYGVDDERKKALGADYWLIQKQVDRTKK